MPLNDKDCPFLCGAKGNIYRVVNGTELLKCPKCGIIYICKDFIDIGQYLFDKTSSTAYYALTEKYDKKTFIERIKLLKSYCYSGNILDIGTNCGTFLKYAKEQGYTAIGIDPNKEACKIGHSNGLDIIHGFFNEDFVRQTISKFDIVHMGDIIEHVNNPKEVLSQVFEVLKHGGLIMVVTPNIDSFLARKFQIKPNEHLVYFSRSTLSKALCDVGFNILSISTTSRYRDILDIDKGTTSLGLVENLFLKIIRALKLNDIVSLCLRRFANDEIMAIGIKE